MSQIRSRGATDISEKTQSEIEATTITVEFSPETATLTISESDRDLDLTGPVCWHFESIPVGWMPAILFLDDHQKLGPFETLGQSGQRVLGQGLDNAPSGGRWRYIAAILRDEPAAESAIFSDPGTICRPPVPGHGTRVEVRVDLEGGTFRIRPFAASVYYGGEVEWSFPNLPPEFAPEVRFRHYEPDIQGEQDLAGKGRRAGEPDSFGPFAELVYGATSIRGQGVSPYRGKHGYDIRITSATWGHGDVSLRSLHSEDPQVDNEMDPPVPPDVVPGTEGA